MTQPQRGWRYIAQRITGDGTMGEVLDWDLPISDVQISRVLSGHDALTGSLDPAYRRLLDSRGNAVLAPYETCIWAENDGDIRGGGILLESDTQDAKLQIECTGYTGYLVDMPYTGEPATVNDPPGWNVAAGKDGGGYGVKVDTLDLVRVIWRHVQRQPGSDLGLEVDTQKSGLKLGTSLEQIEFDTENGTISFEAGPYKLAWHQDHDLSGNIDKLASATPFDYDEKHWWDGDVIRHKLIFGVPRLGKVREDLRFVFGENIYALPSISMSGEDYATEVMLLGAGEGAQMKRGSAKAVNRRGLRRVAVVSKSSIRSQTGVNDEANKQLASRRELEEISDIVVRDTPHAPLGAVELGDTIWLSGKASEWRTVDMQVRVLAITINPEKGNEAVYTVVRTDRLAS